MATWTILAQATTSWTSLAGGEDDWIDPRLTLILTESGLNLHAEDNGFLVIETVSSTPASPWVPA